MNRPLKILYICTHNRCRSILSEAVTNHLAGDIIEARSAGSSPAGEVHPLSLRFLRERGYPVEGLRSESWDAYAAWRPDIAITVCDRAAREPCPLWLGEGIKLHWGLADPSAIEGDDETVARAFNETIDEIERRVRTMAELASSAASAEEFAQMLKNRKPVR